MGKRKTTETTSDTRDLRCECCGQPAEVAKPCEACGNLARVAVDNETGERTPVTDEQAEA